jgi:hypothetical protein
MRWKLRAPALAVLISLAMVSIVSGARAADTATAEEAWERLQVGPEPRRALLRGDVISDTVGERGERELAVGLAMFIPAALGALTEPRAASPPTRSSASAASSSARLDGPNSATRCASVWRV